MGDTAADIYTPLVQWVYMGQLHYGHQSAGLLTCMLVGKISDLSHTTQQHIVYSTCLTTLKPLPPDKTTCHAMKGCWVRDEFCALFGTTADTAKSARTLQNSPTAARPAMRSTVNKGNAGASATVAHATLRPKWVHVVHVTYDTKAVVIRWLSCKSRCALQHGARRST
jgi:hypothetical protein